MEMRVIYTSKSPYTEKIPASYLISDNTLLGITATPIEVCTVKLHDPCCMYVYV